MLHQVLELRGAFRHYNYSLLGNEAFLQRLELLSRQNLRYFVVAAVTKRKSAVKLDLPVDLKICLVEFDKQLREQGKIKFSSLQSFANA